MYSNAAWQCHYLTDDYSRIRIVGLLNVIMASFTLVQTISTPPQQKNVCNMEEHVDGNFLQSYRFREFGSPQFLGAYGPQQIDVGYDSNHPIFDMVLRMEPSGPDDVDIAALGNSSTREATWESNEE